MTIDDIVNNDVKSLLDEAIIELENIVNIIEIFGATSRPAPYMNKYAVIKACGSIERAFKIIISDFLQSHTNNDSLKSFININIRESSKNPSYDNIMSTLKDVDIELKNNFKFQINTLDDKELVLDSLKSLVQDRNNLAHGGSPTVTAHQVVNYFKNAVIVIVILNQVCS